MAEERPLNSNFFCHKCSVEFQELTPEYVCPSCLTGFFEALENNTEFNVEEFTPRRGRSYSGALTSTQPYSAARTRSRGISRRRSSRRRRTRSSHLQQTSFEDTLQSILVSIEWSNLQHSDIALIANQTRFAFASEPFDTVFQQLLNQVGDNGISPLARELIENIPIVQITQEQVDARAQCSICWEDFSLAENVRKLLCEHVYHENCIMPWFESHDTCPICRQNLASGNGAAPNTNGPE